MPRTRAFLFGGFGRSAWSSENTVFGTQTPRGCRKQPRKWQKCKVALVPFHILEGKRHVKSPISCLEMDQSLQKLAWVCHSPHLHSPDKKSNSARSRPQEQNDERPFSLHSIKAHLHSWSIAKTCCCNALTRFCQQASYRTQFPLPCRSVTSSSDNLACWVSQFELRVTNRCA